MNFFFHPDAEKEFADAIDYYEKCDPGLGYDFSIEVFTAIQNITSYPTAWPLVDNEVRRCLISRFPFGIIYSAEESGILILAVMHLRRHPNYWKTRQ